MTNKETDKTVLLIDEGLGEFKENKTTLMGMLTAIRRITPGYKILPISSKQDYDLAIRNEENMRRLYMVFISANTENFGGTLELMDTFPKGIPVIPLDYMGSVTDYIKNVASAIKSSMGQELEILACEPKKSMIN